MLDKDLAFTFENLLKALRECQSLTPIPFTGDPKTAIQLPEIVVSLAREDASKIGVSLEVLTIALLQAYHGAEDTVKLSLATDLNSVLPRAST